MNAVRVAHVFDQASADEVPPLEAEEIDQLRKELNDKLEGEPSRARSSRTPSSRPSNDVWNQGGRLPATTPCWAATAAASSGA